VTQAATLRNLSLICITTLTLTGFIACAEENMADSGLTTLEKQDVAPGTGAEATKGRMVRVHYTGWLYNKSAADHRGAQFDSSRGGEPFEFNLGAGEVIQGWDEGVAGMRVGGKRILTIPAAMGYGAQGAGDDIPPNSTLIFEVELLDVR
jgi:FKBP-type peptidyl-prolyl cis-trans isomerase FkpA